MELFRSNGSRREIGPKAGGRCGALWPNVGMLEVCISRAASGGTRHRRSGGSGREAGQECAVLSGVSAVQILIYASVHIAGEPGYLLPSPAPNNAWQRTRLLGSEELVRPGSDRAGVGSVLQQLPGIS